MQRNSSEFKRIAHRGASAEAPENTIPAIALAVQKYHVDIVEIDLRLSKDGVPVILHDEILERTTDGRGVISDYPLEEIKARDAGFRFDPKGKEEFPFRGKGVTIPTLEEVLRQFPETSFFLEIKERTLDCVEKILSVVRRMRRATPVILGSFHGKVARELRRLSTSSIETFLARDEVIRTYLAFRVGFKKFSLPARYASLPLKEYGIPFDDPKWISFLHNLGVRVYYWTVDEMDEMKKLIESGADGIVTNYPGRLNQILTHPSY